MRSLTKLWERKQVSLASLVLSVSCDCGACSEKRIGMANQFSSSELEEIRVQFDQVYA